MSQGPTLGPRLAELRTTGLTVFEDVLDADELAAARRMLDRLYDRFDPAVDKPMIDVASGAAGAELMTRSPDFNWASVLVGKDAWFRGLMRRAPVFEVVSAVLGRDCILSAMNALEPLRGRGHQALHRDEGPVGPEGPVVVNSLWAIDDIAPANGGTRFVPGTHTTAELVDDDDPRLIRISARAGSVVVFDAHVLHGASRNLTGARRRAVHVYYTRAGRPRQTDWARYLGPEVRGALDTDQRRMVGL
jgi:ectoine hydroxylase-related dioxygenase (phytanoyl-CoA dioxygenase family)